MIKTFKIGPTAMALAVAMFNLVPMAGATDPNTPMARARGEKWPNTPGEGARPIVDYATVYNDDGEKGADNGFTELLAYALPSPNQKDAGSCLYMSHTGIAEWWLNRLHNLTNQAPGGDYDLSERYTMNLSADMAAVDQEPIQDWRTDSIRLFNQQGKSVRNESYRFTQGSYQRGEDGSVVRVGQGNGQVLYGTPYNWLVELGNVKGPFIDLPHFQRSILFADPEHNQWNVAVMPDDIVQRVKTALLTRKAPVNVIYNHMGYWHSVIVLGFNDQLGSGNCSFVRDSIRALQASKKSRPLGDRAASAFERKGCRGRGVFFVRDSIYSDPNAPMYDYDLRRRGEEGHYSTRIIQREYEWLEILSNHAVQVFVD